jgi:autotransporter-associated beta strand protein
LALGSTEGQFSARSNRTLTINSVITGTGGLTLEGDNGSSNIILAGANTYTGVTNMYVGGNVKLTNSLAFQNTTVNFVSGNGMGLIFGNGGTTGQTAYTFGGLSGSQNLNLNNNNTSVGAVALTVGGNGDSTTYSGVLSSTVAGGSLIKTGTGTLTLSGTNTYGGGTTLNDGAIQINNASALGSSGTISFGGGTLKYGTVTTDLSARFSTAASQAYKVDTNGNNVTWATALTSSGGSLVKSGAGTLTTSGANTFSGATTVNSGTLKIASGGALNSSSSISVANGATLENANGGSITPALTLNEGAALTTSAASSSFNPTTLTLTGDLSDGWTAIALTATLGSGLDKTNAALTLTLTGITAGTYNLTSGSGFTGSFSSANINGNALSASGSDWTGTFGGFDYTYTNSTNILSITAVPEPHEFAIAIVALLGVLVFIRRRNQQV